MPNFRLLFHSRSLVWHICKYFSMLKLQVSASCEKGHFLLDVDKVLNFKEHEEQLEIIFEAEF